MKKTVLIIEDDQDILDMMSYILEDAVYDIINATDSKPLGKLRSINPALILLDNRLTDGYGYDFCKKIKLDPITSSIPVILVSAANKLEEMSAMHFADGYLKKPFDLDDLVNIVKKFTA
jgi:two-component system phosphate regulon response regulator PhoB